MNTKAEAGIVVSGRPHSKAIFWALAVIASASVVMTALPLPSVGADTAPVKDLSALLNDLNSSNPAVATQAATEIKNQHAKQAIPALAQAIQHPNEIVRLTVIEALSEIGPDAALAVPALAAALKDKDPMIREAAALALLSVGRQSAGGVPALVSALGDENKRVRDSVVLALVNIGEAAIPDLIKTLES